MYLKNDMFTHGMFYVAASRVTQPHGLKIYKPAKTVNALPLPKESNDPKKIKNSKKKKEDTSTVADEIFTRNVVYQEILTK